MRCYDAARHNEIANDPSVFAHIAPAGCEVIDLSPCLADPEKYILLLGGDAATVFERSNGDEWEMHVFALPSCRGRAAIDAVTDIIRHMFHVEGATFIWGKTQVTNRAALFFHRKLGGKSLGLVEDPNWGMMEAFGATRAEWEAHTAK